MAERKKVSDADAFLRGMRHGILVRRGVQLILDGEMIQFQPGDVIRPSSADLADPGKNPFVAAVANRCRGTRTSGQPIGSQGLSVFESKEALDYATDLYRDQLKSGMKSNAWVLVEAELTKMNSQGRTVRTVAALDKLLARTVSEFHETVVAGVRETLLDELDLAPAG